MRRLALSLAVLLCASVPALAATPRAADHGTGPHVLVTGDSMMRGVHRELEPELAAIQPVSFRSDFRIGSGITKDNWIRIARRQVKKHRPRATAIFMGVNEGFDLPKAPCCGKAWVAAYRRRVKKMIRIYSRKGKADVYWLTLPAPRSGVRRKLFPRINRIIKRAVRESGPRAHVVDTWRVLTPGGRYRRTMVYRGERVPVRSEDGIHLRAAGCQIVAEMIRDAMLEDGVVSR